MSDHIGEPDGMICPHCGLPADRNQNGIQGYRCGSSYCESFRPQWARSMTCLEIENGQLREMFRKANLDDTLQFSPRFDRWICTNEDGKIIKSPSYSKAELERFCQ